MRATARVLASRVEADDGVDVLLSTLDAAELWPRVADAIGQLPDEERDALTLYVWEQLSYDDIAVALGVPVGTVRSRLNRARKNLRELRTAIGREQ